MGVLISYALTALCGALFAYGPSPAHIACLALFIIASRIKNNHRFGVIGIYYVVGLSPLFLAAYDYSANAIYAASGYFMALIANVAILCIAFAVKEQYRSVAIVVALVVLSIPPIASYSVASPLPVAGLIFPGMGVFGLALLVFLIGVVVSGKLRIAGVALLASVGVAHTVYAKGHQNSIEGINTKNGVLTHHEEIIQFEMNRQYQLDIANHSLSNTVVFPEGAFGEWNGSTQKIMSLSEKTILGGARYPIDSDSYANVLMNSQTGVILYAQREPIPLQVAGRQSAKRLNFLEERFLHSVLICNEIANPWISAMTFINSKDSVIWIANFGWTKKTFIERRVKTTAKDWARLFDKNLIAAVNSHG